jgi:hypothetical protein
MDVDNGEEAEEEQDEVEHAPTPDKSDLDGIEDEDDGNLDPVHTAQPTIWHRFEGQGHRSRQGA